jgi:CRISPR-associated protein Cst2
MSENKKVIASISISGEITLNLHSLNNEGGEGNQIITRQVTIVDKAGETHTVNAISGDMFKHIHAEHQANYCIEKGLKLSKLAKLLSPDRIGADELNEVVTKGTQLDVQNGFIKTCTITDTHGVLMVEDVKGVKNTPRKSLIEFGWTVGKPQVTDTESYFHMRGATASSPNPTPFNRPANHGVYAFVCSVDVYRIGFNDFNRSYAIDDKERSERFKSVLMALLSSFTNPKGAMTSTQKPHITDFKGVVAISNKLTPAPTISALNEDYQSEIKKIASSLNKIEPNMIETSEFNGLGNLSEIIADLMSHEPYKIKADTKDESKTAEKK